MGAPPHPPDTHNSSPPVLVLVNFIKHLSLQLANIDAPFLVFWLEAKFPMQWILKYHSRCTSAKMVPYVRVFSDISCWTLHNFSFPYFSLYASSEKEMGTKEVARGESLIIDFSLYHKHTGTYVPYLHSTFCRTWYFRGWDLCIFLL